MRAAFSAEKYRNQPDRCHACSGGFVLVLVWILCEATWVCSGRLCKTVFLIPFPAAGGVHHQAGCSPPPPPPPLRPAPPRLIWNTIYFQSRHVTALVALCALRGFVALCAEGRSTRCQSRRLTVGCCMCQCVMNMYEGPDHTSTPGDEVVSLTDS